MRKRNSEKGQSPSLIKDVFDGFLVKVLPAEEPAPLDVVFDQNKLLESVSRLKRGMNNVLGILEGVYFLPDGYSRNKRFYPRELWENVIRNMEPVLRSKGVLGTLEHPTKEEDAHPRHASHVLKRLWIGEDGKGYGKSYLLNTPIGSLVYILGSATDENGNPLVPLYMSSRGLGKINGYTRDGYEIVDPKTYILQTFDVVLDPGFIEAKPDFVGIVESVLPEVIEMEDRPESFFISLAESLERNDLSLDTVEGEIAISAPLDARVSGFMEQASVYESATQSQSPSFSAKKRREEEEEQAIQLPFEEVSSELSKEDLRYLHSVVEKAEASRVLAGAERSVHGESQALEPLSPVSEENQVALKRLASLVESLKAEVEALKAEVLAQSLGIDYDKARKLLESNGYSLEKAKREGLKALKGQVRRKAKHSSDLDLSRVPVLEARDEVSRGEPEDLALLSSIFGRFE